MPADAGGLLLVHAHPDDEAAATGGTIARYVAEGRRVDVVTCTGGEEGEIHDPDLDGEEARHRLAEIRAAELACSLRALDGGAGLLVGHQLGYRDSGMMGTEANERPEAFWRADLEDATERLVRIVREARPAVIVGYDPNGGYGHPDHIQAHRIAVAAYEGAADPERFPDAGDPHRATKLYEMAWASETWFALMEELHRRGIPLPWNLDAAIDAGGRPAEELNPTNVEAAAQVSAELAAGEPPREFGTPEAVITTRIAIGAHAAAKRASMDCHRTQRQDLGWILDLPDDLFSRAMETEWYVLRRIGPEPAGGHVRETDLFEGL